MRINNLPAIIPFPTNIRFLSGYFSVTPDTLVLSDDTIPGLDSVISYLAEKIESATGYLLHSKARSNQKACVGIFFSLIKDAGIGEEGYELDIEKDAVFIKAGNSSGLLSGATTFFQIVYSEFFSKRASSDQKVKIRCMKITDTPHYAWRGLLLDCSRHFMSKEFIKMLIDILALYKMNKLHWHLTDDQGWRLEIKKFPRLVSIGARRGKGNASYGGFYTQEEVREIIQFAKSRNVEVIPEIEMPGHSVAALASYPEYSCSGGPFDVETKWGIFKDVFCAGNEKTYEFLFSILDEVTELFPSEYIHIGGDEVPPDRWHECPKCSELMTKKGLAREPELEGYFLRRIAEYLKAKGKKTICWDEAMEGGVPADVTIQYWRSFANEEILSRAIKKGHQVIASPVSHCYLDNPTWQIDAQKIHSYDPNVKTADETEGGSILGIECNMWTEHAPEEWVFEKILPRLIGLAEVGWSGPGKQSFESFEERLKAHEKLLEGMGITMGEALGPNLKKAPKPKKPAIIYSTMGTHEGFIPERAYSKEKNIGIYWTGRPAKKGESFTLNLASATRCNRIFVSTKNADVSDNILKKGTLEISNDGKTFIAIAHFKDGIVDVSFETQKIEALRITVLENQESWVAISDIVIEKTS